MNRQSKAGRLFRSVFFWVFLVSGAAFLATAQDDVKETLTFGDDSYEYRIRVDAPISPDSAYTMLADSSTMRYFNNSDSVVIKEVDSDIYDIISKFRYFTVQGSSVFRRKLFPDQDSIAIWVLSFEHSSGMVPVPEKVDAHYKIAQTEEGAAITYYQKVSLDKEIGWMHRKMIGMQLKQFHKKFKALFDVK